MVKELRLRTISTERSFRVTLADGSSQECSESINVRITWQGRDFWVQFFVLPMNHQGILGMTWLKEHNPEIDWRNHTIVIEAPPEPVTPVVTETPVPVDLHLISSMELKEAVRRKEEIFVLFELNHVAEGTKETESDPRVKDLLGEFKDVFNKELPDLPPKRGVEHEIRLLPDSDPPAQAPYRTPLQFLPEVDRQIKLLKEKGLIRDSNSPFAAPILCVKKPDGSIRLCVDYRMLNKITVKDKFPLPRIDELLDRLRGAKYFSKLDLTQGYHQVRVKEEDVHKTAFTTRFGQFEWLVMPFGVAGGPATFQRLMNNVLRDYLGKFVAAYLDDILIYSATLEEHLEHLRKVLLKLRENKLLAKESKCLFAKEGTEFLGHFGSADGIAVLPSKIKAVTDWPRPENVGQLRSFLGLAGFYQKFVWNFAEIAVALTNLLKKDTPYVWSAECEKSFQALKKALTTTPVIRQPDPGLPYTLHTDASDHAIGAVLSQDDGNGLHPIAFTSRKLTAAETAYSVHEKEMLAVIDALKTWRHYLLGCEVHIFTDHHSLQYFSTQPHLSPRQVRWSQFLQDYDVTFHYLSGSKNVVADALSRIPVEDASLASVSLLEVGEEVKSEIRVAYENDKFFTKILSKIKSNSNDTQGSIFRQEDGLLYYTKDQQPRLCIPRNNKIRTSLLQEAHDSASVGHGGVAKTYELLRRHYYWPNLYADVYAYVTSCKICQRTKPLQSKPAGLLQPLEPATAPWDHVSMDFITQLPKTKAGHDAIVVFVDSFSKMAHFAPTTTTVTAPQVARLFFDYIFRLHGLPQKIVSDRDAKFTSNFWKALFQSVDTKLAMSTSFHPQTDGMTERVNRILEQMLRARANYRQDDWDEHLTAAEFAYNNAMQASTKFSPFQLNYGRMPRTPLAIVAPASHKASNVPAVEDFLSQMAAEHQAARENILLAQQRQKSYADMNRSERIFQVGEEVWVSTKHFTPEADRKRPSKKLTADFAGPYKVLKVVSPVAYLLDLPSSLKVHPVFHVSLLKPVKKSPPEFEARIEPPPPPVESEGTQEFEVEAVLDKQLRGRWKSPFYLIKWKGYDASDSTWEPLRNLNNARELIQEFETSRNS